MPIAPRRVRGARCAALIIGAGVLALACGSDPASDASEAFRSKRLSAARAGIDWLVDHADAMPRGWAHTYLLRLHRLAPDDATAARIEGALRADPKGVRASRLPPRIAHRDLLQPLRLVPILFELERRRNLGIPSQEEIAALRALLIRDGGRFWEPIKPTQRLVIIHLLDEIGIEPPQNLERVVRDLEAEAERRSAEDIAADNGMLYALAHVIMVQSGYFRERPDPQSIAFAIPHLLRGLELALEGGGTARSLDLIAEIVGCLTFVGAPADERIDTARRMILAAQKEDGSWGDGQGVTTRRTHLTLNAISATVDWPVRPRPDPDLEM